MRKRLTEAMIEKLRPPVAGRLEIQDDAVAGLTLRLTPNGAKSFVVRGRIKGRAQPLRITVGDARGMRLYDARQRAGEVLRQMRAGEDPREALRQAKREALDAEQLRFDRIVERFIEEYAKPKNSSWRDTESLFKQHLTPRFLGMRLDEIKRSDIKDALAAIRKRVSPYRANAALAAIRKLFNWAKQEEFIEATPGFGGLAAEKADRDRWLSFEEIRLVWRASERLGHPFGPMFQLLLATGQRRGEVANARWASFDLEKERLWTLQAEETKADRKHFVPLSDMALSLLGSLPRIAASKEERAVYCFTTIGSAPVSGFGKAKRKLDAEIEAVRRDESAAEDTGAESLPAMAAWRVHDLRRTVATHMEDALGIAPHIVGSVLNHSPKSYKGVTAIYTRGDLLFQRRQALNAWSRLLALITGDEMLLVKVEQILRPETEADAARTAEFRRMIVADEATWARYVLRLRGDDAGANVVRIA